MTAAAVEDIRAEDMIVADDLGNEVALFDDVLSAVKHLLKQQDVGLSRRDHLDGFDEDVATTPPDSLVKVVADHPHGRTTLTIRQLGQKARQSRALPPRVHEGSRLPAALR